MPKISAPTLVEHRQGTIDKLLDAFGELVMTQGYDAVSLADVAGEAGLARTAIYNYFSDREGLLFAWTDREVHRTIEGLHTAIAEAETGADKLRVFIHSQLLSFTDRHLPPGKEVAQILGPHAYRKFMEHIAPLEQALLDIVAQGVADGEFAEVVPETTVPMVLACIGAERAPLATGDRDLEAATDDVTSFVLRALGAGATPAAESSRSRKR